MHTRTLFSVLVTVWKRVWFWHCLSFLDDTNVGHFVTLTLALWRRWTRRGHGVQQTYLFAKPKTEVYLLSKPWYFSWSLFVLVIYFATGHNLEDELAVPLVALLGDKRIPSSDIIITTSVHVQWIPPAFHPKGYITASDVTEDRR